jgi:hypothetical protein
MAPIARADASRRGHVQPSRAPVGEVLSIL